MLENIKKMQGQIADAKTLEKRERLVAQQRRMAEELLEQKRALADARARARALRRQERQCSLAPFPLSPPLGRVPEPRPPPQVARLLQEAAALDADIAATDQSTASVEFAALPPRRSAASSSASPAKRAALSAAAASAAAAQRRKSPPKPRRRPPLLALALGWTSGRPDALLHRSSVGASSIADEAGASGAPSESRGAGEISDEAPTVGRRSASRASAVPEESFASSAAPPPPRRPGARPAAPATPSEGAASVHYSEESFEQARSFSYNFASFARPAAAPSPPAAAPAPAPAPAPAAAAPAKKPAPAPAAAPRPAQAPAPAPAAPAAGSSGDSASSVSVSLSSEDEERLDRIRKLREELERRKEEARAVHAAVVERQAALKVPPAP
eukprot:tig00021282_g19950.t1